MGFEMMSSFLVFVFACTSVATDSSPADIITDAAIIKPQASSGFLASAPNAHDASTASTAALPAAPGNSVPAAAPQVATQASAANARVGTGTLVVIAIVGTMLVCCVLACCTLCKVCGCLFGGVEDAFDGDGEVGGVAQGEEMALADLGGYEMAGKGLF